jgi:hypothetical protein
MVCMFLPSSLLDLFALNVGEGEIRCVLEGLSCAIRAKESFRLVASCVVGGEVFGFGGDIDRFTVGNCWVGR